MLLKRLFDLVIAGLALCLLSPILLLIAVLVRLNLGGPVLFSQERPGLDSKIFRLYKFRSMSPSVDANGKLLPDEARLGRFGKLLRASSLDELPALWNVVKGDMSLVGPRPLLVRYLPRYNTSQLRRHKVKPGITGWAQVNGRNALDWDAKFQLDLWYVDNQSFMLDIKILWLTVKKVLARDGISADGYVTMPEFTGKLNPRLNVLVLSAGRRVELVKAFQNAVKDACLDASVLAADISPELSSACIVADRAFKVPRATDEDYVTSVLDLCEDNNVGVVIPTIDTELLPLTQARPLFIARGIELLVPDLEIVKACRDKQLTGDLFSKLGIRYPDIYPRSAIKFPCFCKPVDGSCSKGALKLGTPDELSDVLLANPKNMFMELIGPEYVEYTIDVLFSSNGRLLMYVPRERLEVRAGEVSKAVTRKDFVFNLLHDGLSQWDGMRGCVTLQVFVDKDQRQVVGLEINPRFGGGYPLSEAAGASFSSVIVREYLLRSAVGYSDEWEENLMMLRYDAHIVSREADAA